MKFGFRKTDGIKRLETEVSELFDVALAGGLCAQRRQSAKFVLRRVLFGITGTQVFATIRRRRRFARANIEACGLLSHLLTHNALYSCMQMCARLKCK
jgi:hypothetical protein